MRPKDRSRPLLAAAACREEKHCHIFCFHYSPQWRRLGGGVVVNRSETTSTAAASSFFPAAATCTNKSFSGEGELQAFSSHVGKRCPQSFFLAADNKKWKYSFSAGAPSRWEEAEPQRLESVCVGLVSLVGGNKCSF